MSRIDLYIIKRKASTEFSITEPVKLFVKLFFMLWIVANAYAIYLNDTLQFLHVDTRRIINVTAIAIFYSTLLKDLFPQWREFSVILPKQLPLTRFQKFKVMWLMETVNFVTIGFLLFYSILFFLLPRFSIEILHGVCAMAASVFLSFAVRTLFQLEKKTIAGQVLIVLFSFIVANAILFTNHNAYHLVYTLCWSLVIGALFYGGIRTVSSIDVRNPYLFSFSGKIYGKVIKALVLAFVLKAVMLSVNLLFITQKGKYLFDSEVLFVLFLSPAILFTYSFNNFFGFLPSTTNNLLYRSVKPGKELMLMYMRSIMVPLLFDLIITVLFAGLSLRDFEIWTFFMQYILTVAALISIGMMGSALFPVRVNELISFKTPYYASPLLTAIDIVAILILHYVDNLLLTGGFAIATVSMLLFVYINFHRYKFALSSKL